MVIKAITPECSEWLTAMRLLYAYALAEKKDFCSLTCHARKKSKLMALYDKKHMLGCLILFPHEQQIDVCCLLKTIVQYSDEYQIVITKMLKIMYPQHKVFLELKSYKIP